MRSSTLVLLACVTAGAIAVFGFRLNSTATASTDVAADPTVDTFVLQATGDLPSCLIRRSSGEAHIVAVQIEPECDRILPGLSKARSWDEAPDGSVALSADGLAIVTFEIGDGVAYESIAPRTPLMTLVAKN